jgi:hypothetical protein
MNTCIRGSSRAAHSYQRSQFSLFLNLQRASRRPNGVCCSRKQSTQADINNAGAPTNSPTEKPSSSKTPIHLKNMGRKIPEGVIVASQPQNALPELPSSPRYPCPHLTSDEVQNYLGPLYARGWGVYTKIPTQDKPASLMLAKDVSFVWHFPLEEFLIVLNALIKKEKVCLTR